METEYQRRMREEEKKAWEARRPEWEKKQAEQRIKDIEFIKKIVNRFDEEREKAGCRPIANVEELISNCHFFYCEIKLEEMFSANTSSFIQSIVYLNDNYIVHEGKFKFKMDFKPKFDKWFYKNFKDFNLIDFQFYKLKERYRINNEKNT